MYNGCLRDEENATIGTMPTAGPLIWASNRGWLPQRDGLHLRRIAPRTVMLALWVGGVFLGQNTFAQNWSGALGVGSDNVYRGISLTDGRPAWLVDLHYDAGNGWDIGLGASAEHLRGQAAGAQLTAYLDRRWQFDDDWTAKAGLVHYDSPWNAHSGYWRYDEINAAVGYRGRWTVALAVSPDRRRAISSRGGQRSVTTTTSIELTYHQPIAGHWSGDVGIGYANLDPADHVDYQYADAGLSYAMADARVYLLALWTGPMAEPYRATTASRLRWVTSVVWNF